MRRITLIAAGGVRLTAELPASAPADPLIIRTCDPRDQKTSGEHRHVYFLRRFSGSPTFEQVELVDVPCETVEVEQ